MDSRGELGTAALAKTLRAQPPLKIDANVVKKLRNFKETWDVGHCKVACATTGMYEASGSLFWLDNTNPCGLSTTVSWYQFGVARSNWSEATLRLSSTEEHLRRYEFPGSYLTTASTEALATCPPGADNHMLPLLVGHALVWSWFLEIGLAIQNETVDRVMKLYEAALTITLRARCGPLIQECVLDSLQWSEAVRLKYAACGDTFVSFVSKVCSLGELIDTSSNSKLEKSIVDAGLSYQNTAVNKQRCIAILALKPFLPAAEADLATLANLAPEFLYESTKLMRFAQVVSKHTPPGESCDVQVSRCFSWSVQSLSSALRQSCVSADDLKRGWLVGENKDDVGFVQASLVRRDFVQWLRADLVSHAHRLSGEEQNELTRILDVTFNSPQSFDTHFVFAKTTNEKTECDRTKMQWCLAEFKAGLTAEWMKALCGLLHQTFTFCFEEEFGKLASKSNVQFSTFCFEKENASEWTLVDAFQSFFEIYTSKPITIVEKPSTRDDDDDADERAADSKLAWTMAMLRREKVEFFALRKISESATEAELYRPSAGGRLQDLFDECKNGQPGSAKDFEAQPRESSANSPAKYRLLWLNTECFNISHQGDKSLGAKLHRSPVPAVDEIKKCLQWIGKQHDENTVIIVTDARSPAIRKILSAWHESEAAHEAKKVDVWVTYDIPAHDPRGHKKKLPFSNMNREMWFVILPLAKKHFGLKSRTTGTAAGEATTHDNTYTKVPVRPLQSLPRLTLEAKKDIVGGEVSEIAKGAAKKGHPLFWQEFKSLKLCVSVLNDFHISHVFDLSPGSGVMAIACAMEGIAYAGVCGNEAHQKWVHGIMDMATLAVESEPKTETRNPVTKQEKERALQLAAKLKEHFGTAVAEAKKMLNESAEKIDAMEEDDDSSSD